MLFRNITLNSTKIFQFILEHVQHLVQFFINLKYLYICRSRQFVTDLGYHLALWSVTCFAFYQFVICLKADYLNSGLRQDSEEISKKFVNNLRNISSEIISLSTVVPKFESIDVYLSYIYNLAKLSDPSSR